MTTALVAPAPAGAIPSASAQRGVGAATSPVEVRAGRPNFMAWASEFVSRHPEFTNGREAETVALREATALLGPLTEWVAAEFLYAVSVTYIQRKHASELARRMWDTHHEDVERFTVFSYRVSRLYQLAWCRIVVTEGRSALTPFYDAAIESACRALCERECPPAAWESAA